MIHKTLKQWKIRTSNKLIPGRLIISKSEDFTYLVTEADRISEILENNSYQGYCCDVYKYYGNAYAYALVYVTSTKM